MKERSRLALSVGLAVMIHVGFILDTGHSSANASPNKTVNIVQFNLSSLVLVKPEINQQVKIVSSRKQTAVTPDQVKQKTKVKSIPVKKPQNAKLISKDSSAEMPEQTEKKITTITDEIVADRDTPAQAVIEPEQSIQKPSHQIQTASIVREKNAILLQPPQYKSLPPPPAYPRRARLRGQQGTAFIHARLDITGEVIQTRLAKSSGFSLLDNAALKAVYGWDFMPGANSNDSEQVWVEIPVRFILNSDKVS